METITLTQYEIDFLEHWKSRLTLDKNSGYFQHVDKSVLQYFRDILRKYWEQDNVELFPRLLTCTGCDEIIDMVHYVYEKYENLKDGKQETIVAEESFAPTSDEGGE